MTNKKLREIYDSYINGQKKQMVTQIKAYGVGKFHVDFYSWLKHTTNPKAEYAAVVVTYHLINQIRSSV